MGAELLIGLALLVCLACCYCCLRAVRILARRQRPIQEQDLERKVEQIDAIFEAAERRMWLIKLSDRSYWE